MVSHWRTTSFQSAAFRRSTEEDGIRLASLYDSISRTPVSTLSTTNQYGGGTPAAGRTGAAVSPGPPPPPHRPLGDPQVSCNLGDPIAAADRPAASSRSRSRHCYSAGVYPPRCAGRMPWSYAHRHPTSRPMYYEFNLVRQVGPGRVGLIRGNDPLSLITCRPSCINDACKRRLALGLSISEVICTDDRTPVHVGMGLELVKVLPSEALRSATAPWSWATHPAAWSAASHRAIWSNSRGVWSAMILRVNPRRSAHLRLCPAAFEIPPYLPYSTSARHAPFQVPSSGVGATAAVR